MSGVKCQVSGVGFQVSGVRCQVSSVKCQVAGVTCIYFSFLIFSDQMVGPDGGGSVINRAYPV